MEAMHELHGRSVGDGLHEGEALENAISGVAVDRSSLGRGFSVMVTGYGDPVHQARCP